jgi:hypothetical protein
MAQRLKHKVENAAGIIHLIGPTALITTFFPTAQAIAEVDNPTVVANYGARTRRRYPGGKAVNVRATNYERVTGAPAKATTLPGNPIKLERLIEAGPPAKWDISTVTLIGPVTRCYKIAQVLAPFDWILRTPNGKPLKITKPGP